MTSDASLPSGVSPSEGTPQPGHPPTASTGAIPVGNKIKIVVYKGMGGMSNVLAKVPGLTTVVQCGSMLGYASTEGCRQFAHKLNKLNVLDTVADASEAVNRGTIATVEALKTSGGMAASVVGTAYTGLTTVGAAVATGLTVTGRAVAPWVRAAIAHVPKVGPSIVQGMDTTGHTIASAATKAAPVVSTAGGVLSSAASAAGKVIPTAASMALESTAWVAKSVAALTFVTLGLGFAGSRLIARGLACVTGADKRAERLAQHLKETSEHPEEIKESLLSYASSYYAFAKETEQQVREQIGQLQPLPREEGGLILGEGTILTLSPENQSSVLFLLKEANKISPEDGARYESLLQKQRESKEPVTEEMIQITNLIAEKYNELTDGERGKLTPQQFQALDALQKQHFIKIMEDNCYIDTIFLKRKLEDDKNPNPILEKFNSLAEKEQKRLFCEFTRDEIKKLKSEELETVLDTICKNVDQLENPGKKDDAEKDINKLTEKLKKKEAWAEEDFCNLEGLAINHLTDEERAVIKQLKREEVVFYELTPKELEDNISQLEKQLATMENLETEEAKALAVLLATLHAEAPQEMGVSRSTVEKPLIETSESEEELPDQVLAETETLETTTNITLPVEEPVEQPPSASLQEEPIQPFLRSVKVVVPKKPSIQPKKPEIPPPAASLPPPLLLPATATSTPVTPTTPPKKPTMMQGITKVLKAVRGFFRVVGKGITWPFRVAGEKIRELRTKDKKEGQ